MNKYINTHIQVKNIDELVNSKTKWFYLPYSNRPIHKEALLSMQLRYVANLFIYSHITYSSINIKYFLNMIRKEIKHYLDYGILTPRKLLMSQETLITINNYLKAHSQEDYCEKNFGIPLEIDNSKELYEWELICK